MHTYSSLKKDLLQSCLQPSDTVLIHSSMKSIGNVEGGADTVLDVLMDFFGKEGLLVFPTLTYTIYGQEEKIFSPEKSSRFATIWQVLPASGAIHSRGAASEFAKW